MRLEEILFLLTRNKETDSLKIILILILFILVSLQQSNNKTETIRNHQVEKVDLKNKLNDDLNESEIINFESNQKNDFNEAETVNSESDLIENETIDLSNKKVDLTDTISNELGKNINTHIESNDVVKDKSTNELLTITYNGQELSELKKPISKSIDLESRGNMADIIKEIYQGVNIEVWLVNGRIVKGEVMGSYKGVLMLKSAGIINYINDKYIVCFA